MHAYNKLLDMLDIMKPSVRDKIIHLFDKAMEFIASAVIEKCGRYYGLDYPILNFITYFELRSSKPQSNVASKSAKKIAELFNKIIIKLKKYRKQYDKKTYEKKASEELTSYIGMFIEKDFNGWRGIGYDEINNTKPINHEFLESIIEPIVDQYIVKYFDKSGLFNRVQEPGGSDKILVIKFIMDRAVLKDEI